MDFFQRIEERFNYVNPKYLYDQIYEFKLNIVTTQ